ncbi:MAG: hypothetical protein LIO90_10590 [Bacteroidales bacterium]|nr:hypothetical protein [Bacteroidales bacterium]
MTKTLPAILTAVATAFVALPPIQGVSAQTPAGDIDFQKRSIRVTIPALGVSADSVSADYAIELTPTLTSAAGDTLELRPVIFRAKGNARYVDRGRYYKTIPEATCEEYLAGQTILYTAEVSRADAPWIWGEEGVSLSLQREKAGCCTVEPLPSVPVATGAWVVPFTPVWALVPDFTGRAGALSRDNPVLQHISQYRPYDSTRILRKEEGALYVHFPLDKSLLSRDFRDNSETLDKIVDITAQIMADTASNVKVIQIIGLASVEGPVKRNNVLGQERADALKAYVQQRVEVPDSLFEVINGGEAWTELRDQLCDLQFEGRDALLEIIDTETDVDRRERRMRALDGGKPYSYLRDNVLSDQRNSGYLRIYYDYVPDWVAAVINGASPRLGTTDNAAALAELQRVSFDPRSWNALGVALWFAGQPEEAIGYFERAAADGNPEAIANLRQLREAD